MNNLNEEINRIKELLGFTTNINEQINIDTQGQKTGVDVKTPIGNLSLSHTKGTEKTGSIKDDSLSFVKRNSEALKTNNTQIVNFLNKTVKQNWLPKENIVRKTLSTNEQIGIWDEILKNNMFLAADIIRYVYNHDWVKQTVLGKKGEKTEEPPSKTPTEEKPNFPGLTITTPIDVDTSDYYADNSWTLTPEGVKDIEDSFISPILEQKKISTKSCINYIKIDTSASRFRNTGQAANMTFEELSKKRSDSTYSYVMKRLNDIGITEWCNTQNVTLNNKGQNGDGTSGPNPPTGNYYVPKGSVSSQAVLDNKNRNEFGEPHKTKPEYNTHKYNRIDVGLGFDFKIPAGTGNETPPELTIPEFIDKTNYTVKFYGKTKDKWKLSWNMIFYKSKGGKPRKATKDVVSCPKWS